MSQSNASLTYIQGACFGIGAVSIWAGWLVLTRLSVTSSMGATDIAALRFGLAGLILLPVVWKYGTGIRELGWWRLLLVISGAGAPYAIVAASGLQFAPSADAGALLPGVMPLIVALMASIFLNEKLKQIRKIGLVMISMGALTVIATTLQTMDWVRLQGHGFFLCAAFMWASFTVVMRWAKLKPIHATALVSVGSMIGYMPVYFAFAGLRLLEAPVEDILFQAVFQGLFATIISLTLFAKAISLLGAASGAAFGALVPVMAALLGILLLNEWPSPTDWASILAVSIGVYLASGGPLPIKAKLVA